MNEQALIAACYAIAPQELEVQVVQIATELGRYAANRSALISTAESCTGGAIARALTETAGSSSWFDRAFITYSNEAKQHMLGVDLGLLSQHGAVSESVVQVMAQQALERSNAALALAVSGVAGPGGGSAEKPVGTVCFAWVLARPFPKRQLVRRLHIPGDRHAVRLRTAWLSLSIGLALARNEP